MQETSKAPQDEAIICETTLQASQASNINNSCVPKRTRDRGRCEGPYDSAHHGSTHSLKEDDASLVCVFVCLFVDFASLAHDVFLLEGGHLLHSAQGFIEKIF